MCGTIYLLLIVLILAQILQAENVLEFVAPLECQLDAVGTKMENGEKGKRKGKGKGE